MQAGLQYHLQVRRPGSRTPKDSVGKLLKEKRRTEVVSEAGLEPATVSLEG
jgi:hypothetical protein